MKKITQGWKSPSKPPTTSRNVKVKLVCKNKPEQLPITTEGYYQYGFWFHNSHQGKCWEVVEWAELDSNTENQSTESL